MFYRRNTNIQQTRDIVTERGRISSRQRGISRVICVYSADREAHRRSCEYPQREITVKDRAYFEKRYTIRISSRQSGTSYQSGSIQQKWGTSIQRLEYLQNLRKGEYSAERNIAISDKFPADRVGHRIETRKIDHKTHTVQIWF